MHQHKPLKVSVVGVDSQRAKQVVRSLKEHDELRGRFHPVSNARRAEALIADSLQTLQRMVAELGVQIQEVFLLVWDEVKNTIAQLIPVTQQQLKPQGG